MTIRQLQRLGRNLILGGGLLLGWTSSGALFAQAPTIQNGAAPGAGQAAAVQRNYLNKKAIQLPIEINAAARASIQEIQLHVKDHPAAPWVLREKAGPTQKEFIFRAPEDGEYWFTMVTVDKQGRCYPPDLRNEPPGLAVVIDTQPPTVELINLGTTPEGQLIQCEVNDPNVDRMQIRFAYQAGDKMFRPLEPMPGRGGVYCIPTQAVFTGVVQISAEDLAKNQTTRQEHLSRMKSPKAETQQTGATPLPLLPDLKAPGAGAPRELPAGVSGAPPIGPSDPHQVKKPQTQERPSGARPDGSQGPRWIEEKTGADKGPDRFDPLTLAGMTQNNTGGPKIINETPAKPLPAKRQLVNNPKIYLDYQIENAGQANVARVEVWLTRDQGRSWQKHSVAAGKSPIEVQLPGDGLFGLTLAASNGQGAIVAPAGGDQPDSWIEVDTTKPALQISEIQTSHDKGQATVQIRWTAQDKNLADTPVELSYAATPQGPWLLIAKGLPGEGQHRWTPPIGIGTHLHLQLIARDAAGNSTTSITQEAVSLAPPAPPRAVIRTISTSAQIAPPK